MYFPYLTFQVQKLSSARTLPTGSLSFFCYFFQNEEKIKKEKEKKKQKTQNGKVGSEIPLESKADHGEAESESEGGDSSPTSQDECLMDTYKDALSQKLEQDEKTETGTLMETSCFCMQKYCSLVYLLYACLHVWRSVHGLLFCHCQLWSQSGVWNLSTDSWLLITASGQRSAGKATCAYYCLISVLVLMMQAVSADTNINILHNATITE